MPRYVVLYHETPPRAARPSHWDMMFEEDASLRTWALAAAPDSSGPIAAKLLADHRVEYLDYEGPISGDRGSVTRWDQGDYKIVSRTAERWELSLVGQRLRGVATFVREPDADVVTTPATPANQRWTFFLGAAPSATSAS